MGRFARRIGERQRYHPFYCLDTERRNPWRPGLVAQQAINTCCHEPFLPAPNRRLGDARHTHDCAGACAIGGQEHNPAPPDMLLTSVTVSNYRLKAKPVRG